MWLPCCQRIYLANAPACFVYMVMILSVCLSACLGTHGRRGGLLAMSQFALLRHPANVISDQSSPYGHVSRGASYTLTLPSIDLI